MTERGDDVNGEDPFDGLTLDEAFINDAKVREAAASDRMARMERIDEEHRRIVEEARAHVREESRTRPQLMPTSPRPRKRRPWALFVVIVMLITLFVVRSHEGGGPTASPSGGSQSQSNPFDHQSGSQAIQVSGGQPPAGGEEQPQPIGEPAPLPANNGPFTFVAMQSNGKDPVAYDPCRPIHVVVNARTAPPDGDRLFRNALNAVSGATGLQFVVDGATAETPGADRRIYQPDRYPDRWAPVLVAWSDPSESPDLAGAIAGFSGSNWLQTTDGSVYVTGSVVLDGPDVRAAIEAAGPLVAQGIIEHELGHLVGLDHVNDTSQLMYPETTGVVTDYAAGDRRGLAELGRGDCFPDSVKSPNQAVGIDPFEDPVDGLRAAFATTSRAKVRDAGSRREAMRRAARA